MTIEIIPIESREQWLGARKQDLTASSDIAAICGVHPYKSAMQVYAEKKGIVEPPAETNRMRGGRWFQPAVREAFREERKDLIVWESESYYRDPSTRIGCTPDYFGRLADETADFGVGWHPQIVIDAKFVSKQSWLKNWLGWPGEDDDQAIQDHAQGLLDHGWQQTLQIPIYIQFQNFVQVKLTGAKHGMIGALVHDSFDPAYPQLHPLNLDTTDAFEDGGTWDFIEECAAEFWKKFERNEPPAVMPQLDAKLLSKLYPRDDGPVLHLSNNWEAEHLLLEIDRLKQAIEPRAKELKPDLEKLKNLRTAFKAIMGFSQKATCGPWDITCKLINRTPVPATQYRDLQIKKRKT